MPARWMHKLLWAERLEAERLANRATDERARSAVQEARAKSLLYPPPSLEVRAAPIDPPKENRIG